MNAGLGDFLEQDVMEMVRVQMELSISKRSELSETQILIQLLAQKASEGSAVCVLQPQW